MNLQQAERTMRAVLSLSSLREISRVHVCGAFDGSYQVFVIAVRIVRKRVGDDFSGVRRLMHRYTMVKRDDNTEEFGQLWRGSLMYKFCGVIKLYCYRLYFIPISIYHQFVLLIQLYHRADG